MIYTLMGDNVKDISQIFKNRGLNYSDIMGVTNSALIHPTKMNNLEAAVDKVKEHIDKGSTIFVQQDPDADGMTATSILYRYLKMVSPKTKIIVGIQSGKQHGIDLKELRNLDQEIGLVIAPDASSNEHDIHKKVVEEIGAEVVVLDHHEAEKGYSPYATMVNPQLDDYQNKNISGAGVVLKFAQLFDEKYGYKFSDQFYDLAAIGIVADMIEVTTPETVYMVQKGMAEINSPFLKALYKKQDYSMRGTVTPTGISFYIAPLINATARAATIEEKRLVLTAMLASEDYDVPSTKRGAVKGDTETVCEQAVRIMSNIKSRQDRDVQKAIDKIQTKIDDGKLDEHQLIIIDAEGQYSKEFTGLIANKVMSAYQKPVLIGSIHDGKNLAGSGRTYDKSSLPDLRTFLQESDLMNFAEGHGAAHGFSLPKENVPKLLEYANEELKDLDFTPRYLIDFEFDYAEIDIELLNSITNLSKYWARGFDEPYVLFKNVPIAKKSTKIEGSFDAHTLKIETANIDFLKFRVPTKDCQPMIKNELVRADIIGRVTMNEFQGKKKLTVFMEAFEVKTAQAFYF